jgi:hypothetical protein
LGSSFVKPVTEHSSCLLTLHMFGTNLYMCADWCHCYIQSLGLGASSRQIIAGRCSWKNCQIPHGTGDHSQRKILC